MIKIESVNGVCTITREGVDCVLFPGMIIAPEEVKTMVAGGDVVYTIDESIVVVVPKGTKATVHEVPTEQPAAEEVAEPVVVGVQTEAAPAAEVVTETVETPVTTTAKK